MDIRFSASQAVDILVPEQTIPIHHYLRQPHRLVNALVDPTRIEQLGTDIFRLKMRPIAFTTLSLQPTVDMRVWAGSDSTVHLQSVACDIRGIEYINQRFALTLVGKLQPWVINGVTTLRGRAELEVAVDLPSPFLLTPRSILEATGNGLLKSVLMTVKQRLMYQLLLDYRLWATSQTTEESTVPSSLLSINSPLV